MEAAARYAASGDAGQPPVRSSHSNGGLLEQIQRGRQREGGRRGVHWVGHTACRHFFFVFLICTMSLSSSMSASLSLSFSHALGEICNKNGEIRKEEKKDEE